MHFLEKHLMNYLVINRKEREGAEILVGTPPPALGSKGKISAPS